MIGHSRAGFLRCGCISLSSVEIRFRSSTSRPALPACRIMRPALSAAGSGTASEEAMASAFPIITASGVRISCDIPFTQLRRAVSRSSSARLFSRRAAEHLFSS